MREPTQRFEDRAQDYLRSRPGYPRQLLDTLVPLMQTERPKRLAEWRLDWTVADVGAGTGLLSLPFLEAGCRVHAVEPSASMAALAGRMTGRFERLEVHAGTAEATGLADASVDLVVAGQAFHWFDVAAASREWGRILRGPRAAALVRNRRLTTGTKFREAYEAFLQEWGDDYAQVSERYESPERIAALFGDVPEPARLPNRQRLDRGDLKARLRSTSYLPGPGSEREAAMMTAADALFDAHQESGKVELGYLTVVYAGRVKTS